MTIAKFRPRCSSPISSRMNGNFWTVEMMIFLPSSMNLRRSPERSAWPTVAPTWANCLIVSRICLSRIRAVGDDDDRVEDRRVVRCAGRSAGARARRWSSTCRSRPSAGSGSASRRRALRVGEQLAHDVELVVAREDLLRRLLAGLRVLLLDDLGVVLEDVGQALAASGSASRGSRS